MPDPLFTARALLARVPDGYTEGPWYVVGLPWNSGDPYIVAGDEDPHQGTPVCDCALQEELSNADNDAALIALAPDLVSALRAAVEEGDRMRHRRDILAHALDTITAALGLPPEGCDPETVCARIAGLREMAEEMTATYRRCCWPGGHCLDHPDAPRCAACPVARFRAAFPKD